MSQNDPLAALHAAVNCYLSTIQTVAEGMGEACPSIGGPYRYRLGRLRTRLAFDSNPAALEESRAVVEAEVKEFAHKSSTYVERHGIELNRALKGLDEIARRMSERQEFYNTRLRQFAGEMERTSYPADPAQLTDLVALQAAGLLSCVESMSHETQSLMTQLRNEFQQVRERLKEAETTDPVTGLMNRREMTRRIEEHRGLGESPTLLLFTLSSDLPDEAAQQVGARLGSQFRYNDLICRWTAREFLVLFQGAAETARSRSEQILPWVAGRYLLDSGETLELGAEVALVEPERVAPELALVR